MSGPLRIAFFLGSFPVVSETFILRQIVGLLELGHDVRIFANFRPEESAIVHPEVEKHDLLNRTTYVDGPLESVVWEMPVWPADGHTWPPGAIKPIANWRRIAAALPTMARCLCHAPGLTRQLLDPHEYRYQAASWSGLYRLGTLCRQSRGFDVLHAHFGPIGNSFRFARKLWRAPLVVSFHGYDFSTLPRKQGKEMYDRLFAVADAVTVNSNYTRREVENLGCPPAKMHKLPVGFDPGRFEFRERILQPAETLRILTVARLVEIKGHEYAIQAVAELRKQLPAVRYDIVGDGPLRSKLVALIEELGLAETVKLHGDLNGDGVKDLMAAAHVFVLASANVEGDQEGQGLALQEAQACGLPVVTTIHGALPEGLLDGRSGFLVPEREPNALAERLSFLIRHPETWPEMGRQGRKFVEDHYNIHQLNRQLVELYVKTRTRFEGGSLSQVGGVTL